MAVKWTTTGDNSSGGRAKRAELQNLLDADDPNRVDFARVAVQPDEQFFQAPGRDKVRLTGTREERAAQVKREMHEAFPEKRNKEVEVWNV
jgi:hypothetical protein